MTERMTSQELKELQQKIAKKKKSKFNNIKVNHEGIVFDSKKEFFRYQQLQMLLKAGLIQDLKLQPRFKLEVNGQLICTYIADFEYMKGERRIIEDVKGVRTPVFNLKNKLMKAIHDIDVEII